MYVKREIEDTIKKYLFRGKAVVIYGPRRAGKTTLVKKIASEFSHLSVRFINCDEEDQKILLTRAGTSTALKSTIGDAKLVVIDEAQRVRNIGLKLKLLVDTYPDQQIIATGSSSFELSADIAEPMTGRAWEFWLYPFSVAELQPIWQGIEFERRFESLLRYGSYPEVVEVNALDDKRTIVTTIANNYLYKDVLMFGKMKNSDLVRKLLEALALQIGSEVSYTELANLLETNKQTIVNYVRLLEQAFVIFRLRPLARNLRNELKKLRKIYFYDVGVRNALINNLNPLSLRADIGPLWENFIVAERMKRNHNRGRFPNTYFWRTWDKQEIDLVEEEGGVLHGFGIAWKKRRKRPPKAWGDAYPQSTWKVVDRENFLDFLTPS